MTITTTKKRGDPTMVAHLAKLKHSIKELTCTGA
jgi:hypothetical protein